MIFLLVTGLIAHLVNGDVNEKHQLAQSRVSSRFDGLEAPLAAAAASPQQRRIIPTYHNPEDENNLERLCNDPFHSFLCKPVGPRRRIDGKLRAGAVIPPGVLPAASNKNEQTQPLEEGSALLPTSLNVDKTYLPPLSQPPPTLLPEPSYLPPVVSIPEKIRKNPFNQPNVYLPSIQTTSKPKILIPTTTLKLYTAQPEQTKTISNFYLPVNDDPKRPLQQNQPLPFSTNLQVVAVPNNRYLPTDESNILPESTNLSPNIEGQALLADEVKNDEESHTLERLCNDPFHSFLCKPVKPRKRIDGKLRPGAKLPPNFIIGSDSVRRESKVLPLEEGSALLSSSSTQNKAVSPNNNFGVNSDFGKPKKTIPLQSGYNFSNQSPPFGSPSFNSFVTSKPQVPQGPASFNPSIRPSKERSHSNTEQSRNYPAQNNECSCSKHSNPKTTGSPTINTDYGYTTKPSTLQTFYEYPNPSNIQENVVRPSGYEYKRPSTSFTYLTTSRVQSTTTTTPKPIYQYPNPSNIQENVVRPSGYEYNRPSTSFTYPTTSRVQSTTTTTPKPVYQFPNPSNIQENVVRPSGYEYNRPSTTFTYPTTSRVQSTTTTTPKPVYQYPNPTNIQENVVRPSGYEYNRPSTSFTYPTTSRVQSTTTTAPKPIYQYPNPSNIQENVVRPSGYEYNRPSASFTYPTTSRVQSTTTTTPKPIYQYPNPSNIQENVVRPSGYEYNRPSISITYPTTPAKPVIDANPTVIKESIVSPQEKGYQYERPSTIFSYPAKPSPTQVTPTNVEHLNPVPNPSNLESVSLPQKPSGYTYNRPSNPLVLPSNNNFHLSSYSELLQGQLRFGERINSGLLPNIRTISPNQIAHNDEFKPLTNFEII